MVFRIIFMLIIASYMSPFPHATLLPLLVPYSHAWTLFSYGCQVIN